MDLKITAKKICSLLTENIEALKDINLSENDSLIASGLIESFDLINLMNVLETSLGISFNLDMLNIENFETPESIASMLNNMKMKV